MTDLVARGVNFVYAREFVIAERGEAAWPAIVQRMSPDAVATWNKPFTLLGTYSFSAFKALAPAIRGAGRADGEETLARMYEFIAERSLSSVYKVFFRMTKPSFVIGNYPKLWSRFFTTGTVAVGELADDAAVVTFTVPEIFLDWLPPACLGYSRKAVALAGGSDLRMRPIPPVRLPNGEWEAAFRLSWRR